MSTIILFFSGTIDEKYSDKPKKIIGEPVHLGQLADGMEQTDNFTSVFLIKRDSSVSTVTHIQYRS